MLTVLPKMYVNNPANYNNLYKARLNEIHYIRFCILTKPTKNPERSHIIFSILGKCDCHITDIKNTKENILRNLSHLDNNKILQTYKKNQLIVVIKDSVPNQEIKIFEQQTISQFEKIFNIEFYKFIYEQKQQADIFNTLDSIMTDYENGNLEYIGTLPSSNNNQAIYNEIYLHNDASNPSNILQLSDSLNNIEELFFNNTIHADELRPMKYTNPFSILDSILQEEMSKI